MSLNVYKCICENIVLVPCFFTLEELLLFTIADDLAPETIHTTRPNEILNEFLPDMKLSPMSGSCADATSDPWMILMCNSDYASSDLTCVNHFIPVLSKTDLTAHYIDEVTTSLQEEKKQLEDELRIMSPLPQMNKDDMEPGVAVRLLECLSTNRLMEQRVRDITNFQKLQSKLAVKGLAAFEVPADGNCAIHSILFSQGVHEATNGQLASLRKEIADSWLKASLLPRWLHCYQKLSQVYDKVVDNQKHKHLKKVKNEKIKQEPSTTPQKKQKLFVGMQIRRSKKI